MSFMRWLRRFALAQKSNCFLGQSVMVGYRMAIKQSSFYEREEWIKGHKGEQLIASLLREHGWYVIPSYDYTGEDDKAPRLQGEAESLVIPDLDIARDGTRRWAEVKTKEEATKYRKLNRWEHGFPLRHYHHYLRVQEITGDEVWIFIYEESTGHILCGKLDDLSEVKREYNGEKMSRGGMVFFPRDAFKHWLNIQQMEMAI